MLKNYKDFLYELDLGLGDLGGGDDKKDKKKEETPDPDKEIAKAKEKKRKKAKEARAKELDVAEADIKKQLAKTPTDFREEFEKPIADALDNDDRVEYHTLILNIQRWQMPKAKEQDEDAIDSVSPIVKILQDLNDSEYRG
jgi:hypothetical protein